MAKESKTTSRQARASPSARLVRALLERHGLAKHKHAAFVGEFFELSRAAAHQRVNTSTAWTLDEFQALADRFGESLTEVLTAPAAEGHKATLRIGALETACRVWFADQEEPAIEALVALQGGGSYLVIPSATAAGRNGLRVARVEIGPAATALPRVAVLGSEPKESESICESLRTSGIAAFSYQASDALLKDIAKDMYDGYVISWRPSDGSTITPLLSAVRGLSKHSALVLLTGDTRDGSVDPHEVAAAASAFKATLVETPVQPPFLLSALANDGVSASLRHPEAK